MPSMLRFSILLFFSMLCTTRVLGFHGRSTSSSLLTRSFSLAMATTKEVAVGDMLPSVKLTELAASDGKPTPIDLTDLCKGKTVAMFGVPGAFTPGCSKSHLPSFITGMSELKAKGVDMTICVATNDAFVMEAWGSTSGGANAGIRFLSDYDVTLSKAMGIAMETPNGYRTKRFSLIAKDNKITHYFNADKETSDTWAPKVIASL